LRSVNAVSKVVALRIKSGKSLSELEIFKSVRDFSTGQLVRTGTTGLLLLNGGFFRPHLVDEHTNLGRGSFDLSKGDPGERKISSLGIDLDAIEFHNVIQRLSTRYAMKSGATDGTLRIRVEPQYPLLSERLDFAVTDAGIEINPAVA
jgi:hypothetical protein